MRLFISPAKKMNVDTDSFSPRDLPVFLKQTERLLAALRALTPSQRQALWRCNDALAALNEDRLQQMDLHRNLTCALFSYEGIQYRYLAPHVLEEGALDYVVEHLRILSGFYGLLRPFDGVTPYRLEMQAKLCVDKGEGLYAFWGDALARALLAEDDCFIDLASKEYSRAVAPYLEKNARLIRCVFAEEVNGKRVEKGTQCKMARGEMIRFAAQNALSTPTDLKTFDRLGYRFQAAASDEKNYVFLKENGVC